MTTSASPIASPIASPTAPITQTPVARPAAVYDQFRDNLARAVGTPNETDLYRAAEAFGKAHTAALRGKGLHLTVEERQKFQQFLYDYGYYKGQLTREQFTAGHFGPETNIAARALQKATFEAQQQLSMNAPGRTFKDGILGVETAQQFERRNLPPSA